MSDGTKMNISHVKKFSYLICYLAVFTILTACSKSTTEICKEINEILIKDGGDGFTESGWAGCMNRPPEKAQKDLEFFKRNSK